MKDTRSIFLRKLEESVILESWRTLTGQEVEYRHEDARIKHEVQCKGWEYLRKEDVWLLSVLLPTFLLFVGKLVLEVDVECEEEAGEAVENAETKEVARAEHEGAVDEDLSQVVGISWVFEETVVYQSWLLLQSDCLLIVRAQHQDQTKQVKPKQEHNPLLWWLIDSVTSSQRNRYHPIPAQKQKAKHIGSNRRLSHKPAIRKDNILQDPSNPIRPMQCKIQIHPCTEIVEVVHKEDDPEEGGAFEGVDAIPHGKDAWPA